MRPPVVLTTLLLLTLLWWPPPATQAQERRDVVTLAQQQLGSPYQSGGTTPAGFDCSGLMQYVFAQTGIGLPRTAAAQARTSGGTVVGLRDLAPGDLVFFDFDTPPGIDHVALYAGEGWMIHAAAGVGVTWDVLWSDPWWSRAVGGLRLRSTPVPATALPVVGPPSLSREHYRAILCTPRHGQVPPPCAEAGAMYDLLVAAGLDPAVQLGFALKETEFGTTGPGRPPQRNLHNLECNAWDGGTCTGPYHHRFAAYPSYAWATWAWATLLLTRGRYVDAGNWTVEQVLPIYAPPFENDTAQYIAQVRAAVGTWRGQPLPAAVTPPAQELALEAEPLPPLAPCGRMVLVGTVPQLTAPDPDAAHLGFLPAQHEVTRLCRAERPAQRVGTDGATWQVVDSGAAAYIWVDATMLREQEHDDDGGEHDDDGGTDEQNEREE